MEDDYHKRRPRGYTLCPFCEEWVKPGHEGECEIEDDKRNSSATFTAPAIDTELASIGDKKHD